MRLCPMCRVHFHSYLLSVELGRKVFEGEDKELPADTPEELVQVILAARAER